MSKKKIKKNKSEITMTGTKASVTCDDRESAEEQQPVHTYFITVIAVWLICQDGVWLNRSDKARI